MPKKIKMTLERLATLMVEGFEEVKKDIGELKLDMTEVKTDLHELRNDMTEVKRDVGDIKETLGAHGKAIDKDAVTLINHEKRIIALEPAKH